MGRFINCYDLFPLSLKGILIMFCTIVVSDLQTDHTIWMFCSLFKAYCYWPTVVIKLLHWDNGNALVKNKFWKDLKKNTRFF